MRTGGFLKAKEHPKKGLPREIFEETNFKVQVDRLIKTKNRYLGNFHLYGVASEGTNQNN